MNSSFWTGLTGLLATICLVLTAGILLTAIWLSGAPNVAPEASGRGLNDDGFEIVSLSEKSLDSYASITQSPLFFPDRVLPEVFDPEAAEEGEGDGDGTNEEAPVTNLDARVAGIIISPDKRIAMVTDGKAQKTFILQEGMSLEGDQAAWKLDNIDERMVSFSAGGELQAELELEVNTRGLKAPEAARAGNNRRPAANASQPRNNAANPGNNAAGTNSAAEVRRRIAERRAKLRAARERAEKERNQE